MGRCASPWYTQMYEESPNQFAFACDEAWMAGQTSWIWATRLKEHGDVLWLSRLCHAAELRGKSLQRRCRPDDGSSSSQSWQLDDLPKKLNEIELCSTGRVAIDIML